MCVDTRLVLAPCHMHAGRAGVTASCNPCDMEANMGLLGGQEGGLTIVLSLCPQRHALKGCLLRF